MILLKKIFSTFCIAVSAAVLFCSCSNPVQTVPSVSYSEIQTESLTDSQIDVQADVPVISVQEGTYIYDNAGMLTATEFDECNKYAEMLYENYLLNTAVVITDTLNGRTAEQYAAEVYHIIYGDGGSGMVFVINNETNTDAVYKMGCCQRFIDDISERDELYRATKELVVGNYKNAAMTMLKLCEKCPENLLDNSNVFAEKVAEKLSDALGGISPNSVMVVAMDNGTGRSNEELAAEYHQRRFSKINKSNTYTVLLDKRTGTVTANRRLEDMSPELADAVTEASSFASASDYFAAVNSIILGFGGEPVNLNEPDEEDDNDEDAVIFDADYDENVIIFDSEKSEE